jgi:predicted 2-oxoglutarate/Fe(II)-dependent dioxygenase YbiX
MVHKKHIFLFDDVISEELCNTIRNKLDTTTPLEEEWGISTNVQCKYLLDLGHEMDRTIYKIVSNIVDKIRSSNSEIKIGSDSRYQFRKIHGETRLHVDQIIPTKDCSNTPRSMSIIIALNDDYEGGELYFPDQDFKIKLKRGQAIAFPPYWTHPHGATEPLNGTFRYTINTWLFEDKTLYH